MWNMTLLWITTRNNETWNQKKCFKKWKITKPDKDGITVEMLKYGGKNIMGALMTLIKVWNNKSSEWNESLTCLLCKIGDKTSLENCCPLTFFNVIYKVLSKIINSRLTSKSDRYQTWGDQAGFRKDSGHVTTY